MSETNSPRVPPVHPIPQEAFDWYDEYAHGMIDRRTFLDRLRRTCMHESGKSGISGKKAIGICVAGGGGGGAPSCAVSLERIISRCGFDVVDMIPVRRQNLDMKLKVLDITGQWLAS